MRDPHDFVFTPQFLLTAFGGVLILSLVFMALGVSLWVHALVGFLWGLIVMGVAMNE